MSKLSSENLGTNKIIKIILVIVSLVFLCSAIGIKVLNNGQGKNKVVDKEEYSVQKQEKMVTETTVQSGTVTVYYLDEARKSNCRKNSKDRKCW